MNALYAMLYFKQMKKTNTRVSFLLDQNKLRDNVVHYDVSTLQLTRHKLELVFFWHSQ
jgi:hypothetical protein